MKLNENPSAAHHLIASQETPQNGSLASGQQEKLMNMKFWQRWRSSIYQLFLFLSTALKCFTIWLPKQPGQCWNCLFEAMYRQNLQAGDSGENWKVQLLRWRGESSRAEFCYMKCTYLTVRTQEKTDPRNTNRFLLSHRKLRGFWAHSSVWTFSSTVYVDPLWDDSEDMVEIARLRGKFMEGPEDLINRS